MSLEIGCLADHPEAAIRVARWWFDEWGPTSTGTTPEKLADDVRAKLDREELPIHLVAYLDGELVGAVALKAHEFRRRFPERTPWLGALYVRPEFRGRGIGVALVMEVERVAERVKMLGD